jgi:hypothetical protein
VHANIPRRPPRANPAAVHPAQIPPPARSTQNPSAGALHPEPRRRIHPKARRRLHPVVRRCSPTSSTTVPPSSALRRRPQRSRRRPRRPPRRSLADLDALANLDALADRPRRYGELTPVSALFSPCSCSLQYYFLLCLIHARDKHPIQGNGAGSGREMAGVGVFLTDFSSGIC